MPDKLELRWPGKNVGHAVIRDELSGAATLIPYAEVQPRLLIQEASYGDPHAENMVISGDSLFVLKTLLASGYANRVKLVYIDPPFNTGQAFAHYDDGLEHSLWLTMLRDRLELLRQLLTDDGAIFVHIDDNELGYLAVTMDELFGRTNRISVVTFKQGAATGHKAINPGCVTTSNFILIYAKNKTQWRPNRVYTARNRDRRYARFIENRDDDYRAWRFVPLAKAFARFVGFSETSTRKATPNYEDRLDEFVLRNAESVIRTARPSYDAVSAEARAMIDESMLNTSAIFRLHRVGYSDMYFQGGERILFYSDKLKHIDGEFIPGEPLTTIWDDLLSNNLHNEGGVEFPKGKKPEGLIKRVLALGTSADSHDLVLDCFAGSGTTGAVAHKMGRRWIMVDFTDNCQRHIIPRLKRVVEGQDQSGVSLSVGWNGGGGFRAYNLGQALLDRDATLGLWRLSYDNGKLIQAVCLQEGFQLYANGTRHGVRGRRYAHVTEQFVAQELVDALAAELAADEAFTVYCLKAAPNLRLPDSVEVRRIPQALLHVEQK